MIRLYCVLPCVLIIRSFGSPITTSGWWIPRWFTSGWTIGLSVRLGRSLSWPIERLLNAGCRLRPGRKERLRTLLLGRLPRWSGFVMRLSWWNNCPRRMSFSGASVWIFIFDFNCLLVPILIFIYLHIIYTHTTLFNLLSFSQLYPFVWGCFTFIIFKKK